MEKNKKQILSLISDNFDNEIIVRSSSTNEDKENKSNAGKFLSIDNVKNNTKIVEHAINKVIISYKSKNKKNEILIQNYISDSEESGVIFTSDQESGQPYIKINYSNVKKDTRSVTSGKKNTNLIIYYNGSLKNKLKKNTKINKKF